MIAISDRIRLLSFMFLSGLAAASAHADGWLFKNGRFPQGKVTVLALTKSQKTFLDLVRRCSNNRNNERTPYVFRLTPAQAKTLMAEAGMSPTRFAIFESYRGDNGVDLEFNVINRYSEAEFEIPHQLLTADREAKDWEINTMGWLPNPLAAVKPADIKTNTCPKT